MKLVLFILLFVPSILWSQPSLEEIQGMQIADIKKIPSWMSDKKTKPRFKVMILEKLNILLLDHPEEISNHSEKLLELFSDVKKNNKDDGSSYNYILRKKSCLLLSYFNGSQNENESYEMIKSQFLNEDNADVAATCIQVSSMYESKKDETNKVLVQMLNASLKKKTLTDDDSEIATAIIEVLEKFKKKQSYLTLLKVLDSKYPTDIKNKAKRTLETLPQ